MALERQHRNDRWVDSRNHQEAGAASYGEALNFKPLTDFKRLTRDEAQALRTKTPPLSPWRVIGVQAAVGAGMALLVALVSGNQVYGWSLLYGAVTVVVPGALMARGMTSKLSSMSPGASAVSFMLWEMVKIAVSVVMLALAPKLVQPLSWPALLAGLVVCMKVYWVALLWRGSSKR
jgi:ATP synthase protein I